MKRFIIEEEGELLDDFEEELEHMREDFIDTMEDTKQDQVE